MSNNQLSLSLVIPAYNEERYLAACLKAIESQTVKPVEVIVVNNKSSDETAAVARRFKFVTVIDEHRQGRVFARSKGFDAAKGDIIGRIDVDTILPPDWVERVLDFYSDKANLGSACTGYGYFYNLHLPNISGRFGALFAIGLNRLLLGHYILFGSNMALPKSLWLSVKPSTCMRNDIHEDLDLAIHLHRSGYKIEYLSKLRVGLMARHISPEDRDTLWQFFMLWPQTLRVHKRWTWVISWACGVALFVLSPVMLIIGKHNAN
jgi:glycosyltransferase involved in cell wall biosynthesis